MKVLVVAEENNLAKITNYIFSYQSFFKNTEEIDIVRSDFEISGSMEYDRVVIDLYCFEAAVKRCKDTINFESLFLWCEGAVIPVAEHELLDMMLERFLKAEKWQPVKQINKIKIELNHMMKNTVLDTYPSQLQLESTGFCNAQCIMCSHYYAGNENASDIHSEMLEKLSEILPYLDIIIMHGNGEPFVSKSFNETVDLYASYGIRLTTNTNLSVLTEEHIKRINKYFDSIRISCDACTKEIYEGIRQNLMFDRFISNVVKLRDLCPDVPKVMASVLMRQNIEQIPQMVEFAAQYGFQEIVFSNLGTSLIVENEMDNISHYPFLAARQLRNALETGERCGIKVTIPSSFDLSLKNETLCTEELQRIHAAPFFKTETEVQAIREFAKFVVGDQYRIVEELSDCLWEDDLFSCEGICEWCIEKPYINLKGDVFVCCINDSYRIGNIFEYDSFMELWNNDTYKKIRGLFYKGKLPGFCDNCQFILNGSLKKLSIHSPDDEFYHRRHVSRFYHDYCKDNFKC